MRVHSVHGYSIFLIYYMLHMRMVKTDPIQVNERNIIDNWKHELWTKI